MSASSIQQKLYKAYGKVSKALGYPYRVYRPINNLSPLHDENWVADVSASFTMNDGYTSSPTTNMPTWTVYVNGRDLMVGDFLYSEDTQRTFYINSMAPHLPITAVEMPNRITLYEIGYGNNGFGYQPGRGPIVAKDIPAWIDYTSSVESGFGVADGKAGNRAVNVVTWAPTIAMGYKLVDERGFEGDVVSYNHNVLGWGTKIVAVENK